MFGKHPPSVFSTNVNRLPTSFTKGVHADHGAATRLRTALINRVNYTDRESVVSAFGRQVSSRLSHLPICLSFDFDACFR